MCYSQRARLIPHKQFPSRLANTAFKVIELFILLTRDAINQFQCHVFAGTSEKDWHKTPTYYLGTDRYGRDVLSRLMYGARVSLTVAFFAEMCSLLIGMSYSVHLAGFYRGPVDDGLMWFTNVRVVDSITLAHHCNFNCAWFRNVADDHPTAIGITEWVDMARIVRGQFFALRETEYVEATKALGLSNKRTIFSPSPFPIRLALLLSSQPPDLLTPLFTKPRLRSLVSAFNRQLLPGDK